MASSATDSQGSDKDIREKLVKTGHVDVMISVGNNFFYTKSLPCSLWFFDKGKTNELKNEVLFIDARNYYTVVDRTLNEWNEWQLKNMNAIVWLYRGEVDKYKALLEEYKSALEEMIAETGEETLNEIMSDVFIEGFEIAKKHLKTFRESAKKAVEACDKKERKQLQALWDEKIVFIEEIVEVVKEAHWLYSKFGEGKYEDILGLCKITDIETIEEKGWSLTPGAYVGVAPVEDDGVDFEERMTEIHKELLELQAESNKLMDTISQNMKEMGLI